MDRFWISEDLKWTAAVAVATEREWKNGAKIENEVKYGQQIVKKY